MSSQMPRKIYIAPHGRNGKTPAPGQVGTDVRLPPEPQQHCFWTHRPPSAIYGSHRVIRMPLIPLCSPKRTNIIYISSNEHMSEDRESYIICLCATGHPCYLKKKKKKARQKQKKNTQNLITLTQR